MKKKPKPAKDSFLSLRLTQKDRDLFEKAAAKARIPVSLWVQNAAISEAERLLAAR